MQIARVKIKKKVSDYIEMELYDYEDTLMLASNIREEITQDSCIDYSHEKTGQTYKKSTPTEDKVIRLITNRQLNKAVATIKAIDRAVESLSEKEEEFYKYVYINRKKREDVMELMYIEKSTYYHIRKKIIEKVAYQMGII